MSYTKSPVSKSTKKIISKIKSLTILCENIEFQQIKEQKKIKKMRKLKLYNKYIQFFFWRGQ